MSVAMLTATSAVYLVLTIPYQGCAQAHNKQLSKLEEFVWFETPRMQTVQTFQHEELDVVCNFPVTGWKGGNCERGGFLSFQTLDDLVWFETPDVIRYQPKDDGEDISSEAKKTKMEENLWKSEDQLFAEFLFANSLL